MVIPMVDLQIILDSPPLGEVQLAGKGTSSWIFRGEDLDGYLVLRYGARGLCLKLFHRTAPIPECTEWEGVPIRETAIVQNLFADKGLAPRVYGFVLLPNGILAEVVEFAAGGPNYPVHLFDRFYGLLMAHGIRSKCRQYPGGPLKWDAFHEVGAANWIGERFVDWGGKYRQSVFPDFDPGEPIEILGAWRP